MGSRCKNACICASTAPRSAVGTRPRAMAASVNCRTASAGAILPSRSPSTIAAVDDGPDAAAVGDAGPRGASADVARSENRVPVAPADAVEFTVESTGIVGAPGGFIGGLIDVIGRVQLA